MVTLPHERRRNIGLGWMRWLFNLYTSSFSPLFRSCPPWFCGSLLWLSGSVFKVRTVHTTVHSMFGGYQHLVPVVFIRPLLPAPWSLCTLTSLSNGRINRDDRMITCYCYVHSFIVWLYCFLFFSPGVTFVIAHDYRCDNDFLFFHNYLCSHCRSSNAPTAWHAVFAETQAEETRT